MNSLIKEFIGILSKEKEVHSELLKLSVQKKEVLIKNEINSLDEIVAKEREILEKVKDLETKRESIAEKISVNLNISHENTTLDKIIENTQGHIKEQLLNLKTDLNSLISKLILSNDINKNLIQTHINYTSFSLDVMTQSGIAGETYDNSGYTKEDKKTRIGLIDQKA